jgi:hypothetical protein
LEHLFVGTDEAVERGGLGAGSEPFAGGAQPGHDRRPGGLPLGAGDLVSAEVSGECVLIGPDAGVQVGFGLVAPSQPGRHLGRVQRGQHQVAHVLIGGLTGDGQSTATASVAIAAIDRLTPL